MGFRKEYSGLEKQFYEKQKKVSLENVSGWRNNFARNKKKFLLILFLVKLNDLYVRRIPEGSTDWLIEQRL